MSYLHYEKGTISFFAVASVLTVLVSAIIAQPVSNPNEIGGVNCNATWTAVTCPTSPKSPGCTAINHNQGTYPWNGTHNVLNPTLLGDCSDNKDTTGKMCPGMPYHDATFGCTEVNIIPW